MPAATAQQWTPVIRRAPVPGHWCFPPRLLRSTSSLTAVLARNAMLCRHVGCCGLAPSCIPCIWHSAFCSPATAASHNVDDTFWICIPCMLRSCILHHMHAAFLHAVFLPQKRSSRPKLHSALHSSHSAFHQTCIPHPGSLLFLTMQELCIVAVHRRAQAPVPSDVRICSCTRVTDLVCPVVGAEAATEAYG